MRRSSALRFAYLTAVVIKGLDGVIEIVAGLIVAIGGSRAVYKFAVWATAPELASHRHAAHLIRHGAAHLAHSPGPLLVSYLLAHGIIKLLLAINLLRERVWIFPFAVITLLGFMGYMSFRLSVHWSGWLLAFAIFDMVTLALVVNEWLKRDSRIALAFTAPFAHLAGR